MRKKINIAISLFSVTDPENYKIHTHKNKFRIENREFKDIAHIWKDSKMWMANDDHIKNLLKTSRRYN